LHGLPASRSAARIASYRALGLQNAGRAGRDGNSRGKAPPGARPEAIPVDH